MESTAQAPLPEPLKDIPCDALFGDAERNAAFYLNAKKFYKGKNAMRYQEYYDGAVASVRVWDEDTDKEYQHIYLIYRFYVFDVQKQGKKGRPSIDKPCKLKPVGLLNPRKYLAERHEGDLFGFIDMQQPAPAIPTDTWPWA